MRTVAPARTCLSSLLSLTLMTAVTAPAVAKEDREPLERFRARAYNVDWGGATNLDISIYEWTTPEERDGLFKTFSEQGGVAFYTALQRTTDKGFLKLPRSTGRDTRYAWQAEVEGRRRIVLATDRPMGFLGLSRQSNGGGRSFTLVVLDLDPATGGGTGTVIGGTELSVDRETGLRIEKTASPPTKLTKVRSVK
ncbi:MAG: hypothetical protein ACE5EG_08985 [Thermoanaerobaculia bacterium]